MHTHWYQNSFEELVTDVLIVPLLADVAPRRLRGFEPTLAAAIDAANSHHDWRGEPNELALFYADQLSVKLPVGIKRLLLVGMGKQADWDYERMRQAVSSAVHYLKKLRVSSATCILPETTAPATVRDLTAIIQLSTYEFMHYQTLDRPAHGGLEDVQLATLNPSHADEYVRAVRAGEALGQATNYVRDLGNHPANIMTPRHLAADALELIDKQIHVQVFGQKDLEEMKAGALLAVAQGSEQEPQLIVVDYTPAAKPKATVALVGKGITFDSGGISIKPSDGMEEMKIDMAGAATCLGVIAAARAMELPVRLIGILPTTENLPSGTAIKPGDIVTSLSGKTIEIVNTDAEGRVVLADGLTYAANFDPDVIIDIATLTGSVVIALGHDAAGLLGNNQALIDAIHASGERTGERTWSLPLWTEHKEMVKSEVADLKNLGEGRKAGTSTGAAFLSYFVEPTTPWVHLDIAGVGILDKARRPYLTKGCSGWGVRLLIDFLENIEHGSFLSVQHSE